MSSENSTEGQRAGRKPDDLHQPLTSVITFCVCVRFSDKDMRVLMSQNNLLINDYNAATGPPCAAVRAGVSGPGRWLGHCHFAPRRLCDHRRGKSLM